MAVKMEQIEKNKVSLEIVVGAEELTSAINRTAKKLAGEINIPGFRKGKAPRHMIERVVGKEYLVNEALDPLIGPAYSEAVEETAIWPVSRPEVEIIQAEEGQDFIFKAVVDIKPEVELGQYKGLDVPKEAAHVKDEEVEAELKRRQDRHAKIVTVDEAEVQDQDIVTIDFEGFIDGVAFDGGKGENYDLTIGSGSFIPGFEEQLKGAKKDQDVEVNVPFPDEYHSKELAGKDALFKVKIHDIKRKELVPLDDEFAKDVSEFDTLDELREDIRQKMLSAAEVSADARHKEEIMKRVVDNASVEIPESMIDSRIESMMSDLKQNLSQQGINLEMYCAYTGSTEEQLKENYRSQAVIGIKTELVVEAIAKEEKISATEEDMEKEIQKLAERYGRSAEELKTALAASGDIAWFQVGIVNDRTVDMLVENNSAEKKEPEKLAENTDTGKDE